MSDMSVEQGLRMNHASVHRSDTRKRLGRRIADVALTAVVYLLIAIVFGAPMWWALANSFRPTNVIFEHVYPVTWEAFIPTGFTLRNYISVLRLIPGQTYRSLPLLHHVGISVASAGIIVLLSLVFNTMAAYFFGRLKFPGKQILLVYAIATMMIPEQVILVPMFFVARELHLVNSFWALVVPFYASPFVTFALAQFIASNIPIELDEAAIVDGANRWQILWHVIVPGIVPGLLTMSLLEFQNQWNTFYWPLIIIFDEYLQPIQINLAVRGSASGTGLATIVIASLPVIILFLFFQKYYMENISLTGMR
ncbi:MAG: carbohydrate ABC transporter permease [Anaerolineae bacterium]|nr:carbohydrate ABC transporter permease [Anaerolineae bacterium]